MPSGELPEVLALDIGGSKLALALVSQEGELRCHQRVPTATVASGAELVEWVAGQVAAWGAAPRALGISTGGPLDDERGVITTMPRMQMLWEFPLVAELGRALPALSRICLLNDACAACAGEVRFGEGRGLRSVLYLTISTGIGGGAYVGGLLLRGDRGNVAEFGHLIVAPDGPPCDCGARGCLEAVASASGIYRRLVAAGLLADEQRGWAELGPWLRERLQANDARVSAFWSQALVGLATGLADLWTCYVPQAIVLGGGLSQLVLESRLELDRLIAERARLLTFPPGVLRFSQSAHTIPLLGAAAVAGGWVQQER